MWTQHLHTPVFSIPNKGVSEFPLKGHLCWEVSIMQASLVNLSTGYCDWIIAKHANQRYRDLTSQPGFLIVPPAGKCRTSRRRILLHTSWHSLPRQSQIRHLHEPPTVPPTSLDATPKTFSLSVFVFLCKGCRAVGTLTDRKIQELSSDKMYLHHKSLASSHRVYKS